MIQLMMDLLLDLFLIVLLPISTFLVLKSAFKSLVKVTRCPNCDATFGMERTREKRENNVRRYKCGYCGHTEWRDETDIRQKIGM
jgi:Zn ribbon nucleic-acid-binding protein